jgi:ABC-type transporter Mla subunit MlaD
MSNHETETSYFKIGAFVLLGFALIVIALLIFGSKKMFEPTVYIETYFDESVQGITAGSPVKYRGLQIGYVKEIAFSSEIYNGNNKDLNFQLHSRLIYIKIAITSKLFTSLSSEDFDKLLTTEVNNGLRVKLEQQGFTGLTYLELNYIDPKSSPIPQLPWAPENLFIPSAPSTLTQLSTSLQEIVHELKDVDFEKVFKNVDQLSITLQSVAAKTDAVLQKGNQPLESAIWNLKAISDNLRVTSEQLKLYPSQVLFGKPPPPVKFVAK